MSASDIENKRRNLRVILTYTGISMFCILFSTVYEHFSHGVYSNYMIFLFLFPLLGGAIPYSALALFKKTPYPGRMEKSLYNSGIATLSVGSCLSGVLEIYGTTSAYIPVYWIAGCILLAVSLVVYFTSAHKKTAKNR